MFRLFCTAIAMEELAGVEYVPPIDPPVVARPVAAARFLEKK